MFVQIHLNVSISLGVNYSNNIITTFVFGGIIEVLLIIQLFLYIKKPKNFGEYTQFFNATNIDQKWYLFVFFYRTIISFIIVFLGSSMFGVYIALALSLISLIAQLVKKPYLHNIRPAVNCIFVFSILTIFTISKLFQDSSSTSIYTSYTPFMLLAILFLALIFNAVCMAIHFFRKCGKKRGKENAK